MEHVINNIKKIREKKGYSQEYMGQELFITQVAYAKIEKLQTRLTVHRLFKIAEIFEVCITKLLGIEVDMGLEQKIKDTESVYLLRIDHFYKESKVQNEKIIELYEARLQDKDRLINRLENLIK